MRFRNAAVVSLVFLAGCQRMVMVQTTAMAHAPRSDDVEMQTFTRMVNDYRRKVGCTPLQWDDRIAAVAQKHSDDMARRHYFDHNNPEGKSPFDRLRLAHVSFRGAAENIASGQVTGSQVFNSWLNSPGHRRNIENCSYTHHGLGLANAYWTHDFISLP
jgi:uncharacterized protein YkwD